MSVASMRRSRSCAGAIAVAACCLGFVVQGLAQEVQPAARKWIEEEYIEWLEKESILYQARELLASISGNGDQWRNRYAEPQPREAVKQASVWVLGYAGSVVTRPGESVIGTWADPELWEAFQEIGIDLLHTGPVKRSGGITRRDYTETIDGWFDRVSLDIDPQLGTEDEYRRMVQTADEHGGRARRSDRR